MASPTKKMPVSYEGMSWATISSAPVRKVDQNDLSTVVRDRLEKCSFFQGDSLIFPSEELGDDMKRLGKKILQHEVDIKYLKNLRNNSGLKIAELESFLEKHTNEGKTVTNNMISELETIESILQHDKSAASILCNQGDQMSSMSDVLGVVATLGKVEDINLSRLLSEYLGLDSMLALVCKTYDDGVKVLETYDEQGTINKRTGLYECGASIGKSLDGRFKVICLEDLRPYIGEFMPYDPQRRLDLLKPKLPNGEYPEGFLGFAVNMIYINSDYLSFVTNDGDAGLRETLFYSLFSRLQVYKTWNSMLEALPLISHGAISLDGGIMRASGVFTLGDREDIDVQFAICSRDSFLPEEYIEMKKELSELRWKKNNITDDIAREEDSLTRARIDFEAKKEEFVMSLAKSSKNATS